MLWLDQKKLRSSQPIAVGEGFFTSTPIATPDGWRLAGDLQRGDSVLTFDAGCHILCDVQRHRAVPAAMPAQMPLYLPAGTFGDHDAVFLPPEQTVLIESDLAEEIYGEAFVTVPALALEGWRGCARRTAPDDVIVSLTLDSAQLVYAGGDLLLGCAGMPTLAALIGGDTPAAVPLGPAAARHLIACMMAEEAGTDLRRGAMAGR